MGIAVADCGLRFLASVLFFVFLVAISIAVAVVQKNIKSRRVKEVYIFKHGLHGNTSEWFQCSLAVRCLVNVLT